ncbi:ABC transporter [Pseudomonas sp. ADAK18]|uniref:Gldg family protein n=1 Tax=Pseudomonas sp. ADAK18 TaxID=2730848 RepID=UPI001463D47E|nr:Gldg family protein [Pseudomonas sp. ADAK18]QJI28222.1 ABC transporter [Pseudomonas sp. ADAK18]
MKPLISIAITLIVTLLLFLAFNLVWALKLPNTRLYLSEQKIHTLSEPTNTMLATLEHSMDLYFFNSRKHPQKSAVLERYGRDVETLLKEYEKAANGKIRLHLIDPMPFSEDEYKAKLLGLDGKQGFFGLVGVNANNAAQKIESFSPGQESLLEYEISHLISKVTHPEQAVIGLISGLPMDGERDEHNRTTSPPWRLLQEIRRHFNLMSLANDIEQIPDHVKTLMLVHPKRLPDRTLYAIDQFVQGGGKLMLFIDPLSELDTSPETSDKYSNLPGMLTAWGLQMPAHKVLADRLYATPVVLTDGHPPIRHPAALTLPRQAMAQNDVSTWKLGTVTVLSSGALIALKKSRTTFTPLLQSSGQAALFDAGRFASPTEFDSLNNEATTRGQRHVIAARIQGPAYSAFAGDTNVQNTGLQKAAHIHVVVIADTDLLSDRVWSAIQDRNGKSITYSGNARFVLNTLDNLSGPDTLMNIRPHAGIRRPLLVLEKLRNDAAQDYREKSAALELRLDQTEKEWQSLQLPSFSTGVVTPNPLLQALNKERLRLPMELHALKIQAYAKVYALERNVKLLNTVTLPLILSLIALGVFLSRRYRQFPPSAIHY